jgi:membrane associated rhomboid family serine protease
VNDPTLFFCPRCRGRPTPEPRCPRCGGARFDAGDADFLGSLFEPERERRRRFSHLLGLIMTVGAYYASLDLAASGGPPLFALGPVLPWLGFSFVARGILFLARSPTEVQLEWRGGRGRRRRLRQIGLRLLTGPVVPVAGVTFVFSSALLILDEAGLNGYARQTFAVRDGAGWAGHLTAALTHSDWTHLYGNLLGLALAGSLVDLRLGRLAALVVLVGGSLTGTWVYDTWFRGDGEVGMGLSAGIYALVGALAAAAPRASLPAAPLFGVPFDYARVPMPMFVGLVVLAGDAIALLEQRPVGVSAHLGGLAFGLLLGRLLRDRLTPHSHFWTLAPYT